MTWYFWQCPSKKQPVCLEITADRRFVKGQGTERCRQGHQKGQSHTRTGNSRKLLLTLVLKGQREADVVGTSRELNPGEKVGQDLRGRNIVPTKPQPSKEGAVRINTPTSSPLRTLHWLNTTRNQRAKDLGRRSDRSQLPRAQSRKDKRWMIQRTNGN